MEIEVRKDKVMSHFDTGGGFREVRAIITIDDNLHPRMKRTIAIYETLGCLLSYAIPSSERENITGALMDVLDQLEPIGVENDSK